jgi:hypothetical protein
LTLTIHRQRKPSENQKENPKTVPDGTPFAVLRSYTKISQLSLEKHGEWEWPDLQFHIFLSFYPSSQTEKHLTATESKNATLTISL